MSDINLTSGPPETVLAPEGGVVIEALAAASDLPDDTDRRTAVAAIVAANPKSLLAWATMGDLGRDPVERYAYYRVGYHRGLDRLRAEGWRGSGYVRWVYPSNQPFLRCLDGLRAAATQINERDEAERCALFLRQLDPGWDAR
jgi:hypothetical protein